MTTVATKKRVLLYLGKFPGFGFDVDGGSILARQLIDTLKERCILDVVFIRKNDELFNDPEIHNIKYVKYKDARNNKFVRRLKNLDTNREAIGNYQEYDIIVAAHASKFFGFEEYPDDFWKRTVLFPMFVTSSYFRAGEDVPPKYTLLESAVISNVAHIIVPSHNDLNDLVSDYQIPASKVSVVYRGIDPVFLNTRDTFPINMLHIVCIGSIKKQKNNLDALRVLKSVKKAGVNADITFICTVQDQDLYSDMIDYTNENNLTDCVHYCFQVPQAEVAAILKQMDVNISVSLWETFGRGIFEGVAAGLPTFVYSHLKCVSEICAGNKGICFASDAEDMALKITAVFNDVSLYHHMVAELPELTRKVSYLTEKEKLLTAIIG